MKLSLGYAFGTNEFMWDINRKRLTYTQLTCVKYCGNTSKIYLAARIFRECVKLVLNDVIHNDVEFKLPTGKKRSSIYIKSYSGELFKKARLRGQFKDIDYLTSLFTGYLLVFHMQSKMSGLNLKPIYVNREYKDLITEATNNGKVFKHLKETTMYTYIPLLEQIFPEVDRKTIEYVLSYGWKSLYLYNSVGADTVCRDKNFFFLIGNLTENSLAHFAYYLQKMSVKLCTLYKKGRLANADEEVSYFGLTCPIEELADPSVVVHKLYKECAIYRASATYLYQVRYNTGKAMRKRVALDDLNRDSIQLVCTRSPLTFKDVFNLL